MNIKTLYQKYQESSYKITTDTRKIPKGSLFFALKGEKFDGNNYAEEALEKGASYAIIDDEQVYTDSRMVLVDNVLETLQNLANYHRNQLQTPIIAITGSNGKTTTKELINSTLSESFKVTATQGNLNNHIGVPLTLLSITPDTDISIVEMGANHPKEIEFLCKIAEPDFGYITNFGKAHLEGFGSLEGVIKAKSELYEYLKKNNKTIFYNYDDEVQVNLISDYKNTFSFGQAEEANITLKTINTSDTISVSYNDYIIQSQLIGSYNIPNISIAVAIGRYFKMLPETIARGVNSYIPKNNRSQIIERNSNKIILDAYNANPTSMRAAIKNMLDTDGERKILILGDMRELGSSSEGEHQDLINYISSYTWDCVCLFGEEFSKTKTKFHIFSEFVHLQEFVEKYSPKNSTILIKGSRTMALERILDFLFLIFQTCEVDKILDISVLSFCFPLSC